MADVIDLTAVTRQMDAHEAELAVLEGRRQCCANQLAVGLIDAREIAAINARVIELATVVALAQSDLQIALDLLEPQTGDDRSHERRRVLP